MINNIEPVIKPFATKTYIPKKMESMTSIIVKEETDLGIPMELSSDKPEHVQTPDVSSPLPIEWYPVPDLGYPVPDLGYPLPDLDYYVPDFGYPVPDFGYPIP